MILPYKITLEELSKAGKDFKWPNHHCGACQRNMWGHGYVARYFTAILNVVYLKRYRCPGCGVVMTIRPEGYWPHIRSSIFAAYEALKSKLRHGRWPPLFPRQRGWHWLKRMVLFAQMEAVKNLTSFLDYCYLKQIRFLP
jgi:hypothetical protein